jgi:hypothetical protein
MKDLAFARNQRQSVLMKNSRTNVLPFPSPPEEPEGSTIVVQIGDERFAIHWEIEDLPRVESLVLWKPGADKVTAKIVK